MLHSKLPYGAKKKTIKKKYNITSHNGVRMHSHQAYIGEYRETTEEHILNKIQVWDANSLLLKEYTTFLSSSLKEGMLRQTNISEAVLYFGIPNSFRKLLLDLYAILKFFNAVFEQSFHNIEQYKLDSKI